MELRQGKREKYLQVLVYYRFPGHWFLSFPEMPFFRPVKSIELLCRLFGMIDDHTLSSLGSNLEIGAYWVCIRGIIYGIFFQM